METLKGLLSDDSDDEFLPYLWGMETFERGFLYVHLPTVLTVPMRNGNVGTVHLPTEHEMSSYRTYEEWKRSYASKNKGTWTAFLPYLWGMETCMKELKTHRYSSSYRTYEEWKPHCGKVDEHNTISSYRTYEEWKLWWFNRYNNRL